MRKKTYKRSLDAIMQADVVDLWNEAPQRWPISPQRFAQLAKEQRIRTFDSPRKAFARHIEEQMAAGFPVIGHQDSAANRGRHD